jgi:DNA-binding MarR family transcriptional regulator
LQLVEEASAAHAEEVTHRDAHALLGEDRMHLAAQHAAAVQLDWAAGLDIRDAGIYPHLVALECYASSARIAARQLTHRYDNAFKSIGITQAQFSMMRRLARLDRATLTAWAESVRLDRSTVGRNARVLESRGLVERSTGDDRREQVFSITDHGHEVMAASVPLWRAAQAEFEAEMGEQRAQELRALLHAVG